MVGMSVEQILAAKFVGKRCTLDGRRARVGGSEEWEFARVYTTDGAKGALEYEWSWLGVKHIMEEHGGTFKS